MMTLVALLVFSAFVCAFAEITLDGHVLVLDDTNWKEAQAQHSKLLVEFYAPWCGHCKSLAPEWAKAATALKDSSVKLAKVDATLATTLAKEYEIKGFPTIKFFKNGKVSDYQGGRTEKDIVSFVQKKEGPAVKNVATEEDLLKLQEANRAFVIGAFPSSSDNSKAYETFAAEADFDFPFAVTSSPTVLSKLAITKDTLVVLKAFDDKRADLDISAGLNTDAAANFIRGEVSPLVQEFSQESSRDIFSSKITKHALFFTDKTASHHASTVATFTEAARSFKGKALFVNVPSTEENKRVLEFFGIANDQLPYFVLADMDGEGGQMKKYVFSGELSKDSVEAFISNFFAGGLKPTLKSEEPTPDDTAGDVVVVKGKSFHDLVINNSKDVFIEFYAPWCGHCKQLAPTWDALGKKFSSNDNIVIAKIDATANEIDVEGLAVKGFPTLFFLKGDKKDKPIKYEGGRELDDLVDYLKENAHNAVHDEL